MKYDRMLEENKRGIVKTLPPKHVLFCTDSERESPFLLWVWGYRGLAGTSAPPASFACALVLAFIRRQPKKTYTRRKKKMMPLRQDGGALVAHSKGEEEKMDFLIFIQRIVDIMRKPVQTNQRKRKKKWLLASLGLLRIFFLYFSLISKKNKKNIKIKLRNHKIK